MYSVGGDGEVPGVGGSEGVEHGGVSGISRPPAAKQKQSEVPGNLSLAEGLRLKPQSLNSRLVKGFLSGVMFGAPVKSCISKSSSCVSGATTSCSLSSHNLLETKHGIFTNVTLRTMPWCLMFRINELYVSERYFCISMPTLI